MVVFALVVGTASSLGAQTIGNPRPRPKPAPTSPVGGVHIDCLPGCFSVDVEPANGETQISQPSNSGPWTTQFRVFNTGTSDDSYIFSCSVTGGISCSGVSPGSASLTHGTNTLVTATYSVGATSGTLTFTATGAATGFATDTITAWAPPSVTILAPGLTSGSTAVVSSRTPVIRVRLLPGFYPIDTTKTVLLWRTDTITKWRGDSLTVARVNRGLIEWEVDSTLGLTGVGADSSALITVRACDTHSGCTTVTRTARLPNDSTAVLSWNGTPFEALGSGFSAPFGPGISVSGAEVETGYSSIPYFAMGGARSAGLVYSTRQSYPRVLVPVHIELRWPTVGTPDQIVVRLKDGGVVKDTLKLTNPSCTTGAALTCRVVLQGDFASSTFPTPTRKWLKVEVAVTKGATLKTSIDSVEAVLVDRRQTMYGSGWWPSGFSKLVAAGEDRLLVGSTGTATIYRGNGDSLYLPPPGSFVTLKKTGSGWELRARGDSAVVRFDSYGRLAAAVDRNGNLDSLAYGNGGLDTLKKLRDPTGHEITLGYNSSGRLSNLTDPVGRVTKDSINTTTNQLFYDSLPSPTGTPLTSRYVYLAYPDSTLKTVVLTQRIGVLTDTTIVVYDSTFRRRPKQALLPLVQDPSGSWVKPTITYTAVESRGYGGLVRTDSAGPYVQITDPLGHFTRTWLNRWAQNRLTWDTLGLISRSRYAGDGRVLTSEGKRGGDTTRVYSGYDSQQRLVRSWINRVENGRGILRLDSLVYDANHRVVKRVDSRGQVDSITYDGKGNVTETRDPAGYVSKYWYLADGRVDSMLPPSTNVFTRYTYETTWKQRVATLMVKFGAKTLLDSATYDTYGRGATSFQRVKVRIATGVTKWQWRKTTPYYRVTNQTDSAIVARTDECDPCLSPPAFGTDSAHTQKVGYRFDRGGRDSLRLVSNDTSKATRYLYDRLGRVLSRRSPSTLGTPPRDSLVYDIAGNLKKTITRRGDTIQVSYDSRNRDTATVVPGVGTLMRVYAGPLDQMTRVYFANAVDSIGGVNGELRYRFDKRGRLLTDTAYVGSTARWTSYSYDNFERDSAIANANGAWTIRYDAARGLLSKVVTPFDDSTSYGFDGQGRMVNRSTLSSGALESQDYQYTATSTTALIAHTVASTWNAGTYDPEGHPDDDWTGDALGPTWTEQHGSGMAVDSSVDSLRYDGWERLLSWRQYRQTPTWGLFASDSMWFDKDGNIYTPGGSESYEAKTGRLLSRVSAPWTYTFSYDSAGNQRQIVATKVAGTRTWTYGYDALNRLISVRYKVSGWPADSLVARYGYDVLGRRIVKRVYRSVTGGDVGYIRYIYRGSQVAFETDSGGTVLRQYTWGSGVDDLLGVRDSTSGTVVQYSVVQDQLGSIRGVVKRDGTWILNQRFTPYGLLLAKDSSGAGPRIPYQWAGREYDKETGWYYNRARYYDPAQRRFVQEDPAGYEGGVNLYGYVSGQPLEARDPSGLSMNYDATHPVSYDGRNMEVGGFGGGGSAGLIAWGEGEWDAFEARQQANQHTEMVVTYADGHTYTCTVGSCPSWVATAQAQQGPGDPSQSGFVTFEGRSYTIAGEYGMTIAFGTYQTSHGEFGTYYRVGFDAGVGISAGPEVGVSTNIASFSGISGGGCEGVGVTVCVTGNDAGFTVSATPGTGAYGTAGYTRVIPQGQIGSHP